MQTETTNEQFQIFVKATRYMTVAERTSTAAEFPGAPPENLVAVSVVFTPPAHYTVGTRGKGEISSGSNHLGFRCVRPAAMTAATQK